MGEIVIYEQEGRPVEVRLDGDSVWLTQRQMADVLYTTPSNIGMHIVHIYINMISREKHQLPRNLW